MSARGIGTRPVKNPPVSTRLKGHQLRNLEKGKFVFPVFDSFQEFWIDPEKLRFVTDRLIKEPARIEKCWTCSSILLDFALSVVVGQGRLFTRPP